MELNGAEVMDNPLVNRKLLVFFFPSAILVPCSQTALDYRKYSSQTRIQPESNNSNISQSFSCSLRKQFPGEERMPCFSPCFPLWGYGASSQQAWQWGQPWGPLWWGQMSWAVVEGDTESLPVVVGLHVLVPEPVIIFYPRSVIDNSSTLEGDNWPLCLSLLMGRQRTRPHVECLSLAQPNTGNSPHVSW